ncbi:hypothetical protein EV196_103129 [Mariniflexile fucanivorans]|uniref:Uncharacterized protein n=1 Tax=Mariniflexile fucanivorans TaxID=264023 RepID=A0A4R1RKW2_9FLAO|nr:hypothetical protein [Mariniflexile fucanivorans]TCL66716.1 hypothetical protein EV196_103129 [Mariniflexile fucanivorans]
MKTVLVFKTSISKKRHIKTVQPFLNNLIGKNGFWNFDLQDCDNILRIETKIIKSDSICSVLNNHGFLCEELY